MFLSHWASYLDIKNGSRISNLSVLDPFAVFSFAILCFLVLLAIFLLAFTSRLSAAEYWTTTAVRRVPGSYMPACKRRRLSLFSRSEAARGSGRGGSERLATYYHDETSANPRNEHELEDGPELTFSPQEGSSSFSSFYPGPHEYPDE